MSRARLVPALERGQDGDDPLQPRIDIGVAAGVVTDLGQRLAEMGFEDGGVPGFALDGRREGRSVAPGRRLPVAADRDVDDPRVVGADILVGEAEALQRPWPEILDDDIGRLAKRLGDLTRLEPVEIEAETSFAGVLLHEV